MSYVPVSAGPLSANLLPASHSRLGFSTCSTGNHSHLLPTSKFTRLVIPVISEFRKVSPRKPPHSLLPSGCFTEYLSPCFSTYCFTNPNVLELCSSGPGLCNTLSPGPGNSLPSLSAHSKNSYICIWNVL